MTVTTLDSAKKIRSGKRTKTASMGSKTSSSNAPSIHPIEPISIEDCVASRRLIHNTAYHQFNAFEIEQIQNNLLKWYDAEQRTNMPWRKPTRSDLDRKALGQRAYEVWVSEIMLQQTQVATVIDYYNRWMTAFPSIFDLAAADIEQVNTLWAGLGYYSRAKRLWEGAKKVVKEFDGILPNNAKDLEKHIPGVGPYTAGAIASIVFGQQTSLVDGNVIRVLARLRSIGADMKKANVIELFWQIATTLVPSERPGDFNQALMELGARICSPQNPNCDGCPIQTQCSALVQLRLHGELLSKDGGFWNQKETAALIEHDCKYCPAITKDLDHDEYSVTRYPVKADKKPPRDEECAVSIVEKIPCEGTDDGLSEGSLYLISRRPDKGLLAGLWEFPSLELDNKQTTYEQRSTLSSTFLKNQYNLDLMDGTLDVKKQDLGNVVHLFSHIRKVYHIEWISISSSILKQTSTEQTKWITMDELKTAPIPTGLKKAIKLLEKAQGRSSSSSSSSRFGNNNNKRKQPPSSSGSKNITSFFQKRAR
ncbi:DNA glycosylase [Halteromyces radiatus]|uniref:DNA glycosylase n=1 Tax=Halteromyces radiatus TaxID=101107 RepID=UPI00221E7F1E|nr:DNA glycosylase [Halteromyces radiatus]KAI8097144.1 DNA glycosylase [Halteromyces radiatus]